MSTEAIIFICLRLFFGFSIAFLAILTWAKTREASWILIISGTLVRYVELIYSILIDLEVLNTQWGYVSSINLIKIILTILPLILFSTGFLLHLIKYKKY